MRLLTPVSKYIHYYIHIGIYEYSGVDLLHTPAQWPHKATLYQKKTVITVNLNNTICV